MSSRRFGTLNEFAEFLNRKCMPMHEVIRSIDDFDALREAVDALRSRMPSIGFFSPSRRVQCFYAVCRQLDAFIDKGRLTIDDALMALNMLGFESGRFRKAVRMFRRRWARRREGDRASLPQVTRFYMDGIGTCL
ncbi:hypothetical protein RVX_R18310 [Nitratidesulfovibrio sp. HK-II]|uniref:hypothetical protein n=1 Tax=Nitratidesulfovibrio sp. HK-II TaxID=2009266 RepID=UPI000E2F7753|nr:hypothetical protein [Nitratidesulfovibrio sp. HK-II]GBO96161.1 hypothetical protein RVX_1201 [Nitratidesulfovibrio sp. HK-II]